MQKVDYYKEEIKFPGLVARGSSDKMAVHRVQENVNLMYKNFGVKKKIRIDDDFGGFTETAIQELQVLFEIEETGIVNEETWNHLIAPISTAFTCALEETDDLRENVLSRAQLMLDCSPMELGKNSGPWVRSFMLGKDGEWAAWCAGSVCTIYYLEAQRLMDRGIKIDPMSFEYSWSVPKMVMEAKREGRWIDPFNILKEEFQVGDFFVVYNPKSEYIYTHIGIIIVIDKEKGIIVTCEGNTNDEGSAEGYEWCKRQRSITKGQIGIIKI